MHILIVVDDFEKVFGGIEYQASRLRTGLQSAGYRADVVSPSQAGVALRRGYDRVLFEGIRRPSLLSYLVKKRRYGHTHFYLATHGSFFVPSHIRELRSLGYRPELAHVLKVQFDRTFMATILKSMDRIIVLSDSEATDLCQLFAIPYEKMRVIPHVIPEPSPPDSRGTTESGIDQGQYFLTISRIDRRKNVVASVRAARLACANLLIAGKDGGELGNVRREIDQAGSSNVRYLGTVSETVKAHLISGATAVVIPSYFEGIPVILVESLRLGTPVISTRLSYAPITEGVFLCDPTPEAIAGEMRSLMKAPYRYQTLNYPSEREVIDQYLQLFSDIYPPFGPFR